MKDGWHTIYGNDVYVENGRVLRGTTGEGVSYKPVYPYRTHQGVWVNASGLTVNAFRCGLKRGTIVMA